MRLAALIAAGRSAQASDLHLEPGLPAGLRVRGQLRSVGEPIPGAELLAVLLGTQSVKAIVRQGQFFKLQTALETGGNDGLFTFARYRDWMEKRTDWQSPPAETAPDEMPAAEAPLPPPRRAARKTADVEMKISPGDEDLARILSELEDE